MEETAIKHSKVPTLVSILHSHLQLLLDIHWKKPEFQSYWVTESMFTHMWMYKRWTEAPRSNNLHKQQNIPLFLLCATLQLQEEVLCHTTMLSDIYSVLQICSIIGLD